MKNIYKYSLILFALIAWSCEEVENDFDIAATSAGPYVEFTDDVDTLEVSEGGAQNLIARMSYGIPHNTDVSISISSDNAIFGTDYDILNEGITDGDGGILTINYDPDVENLDRDTLMLEFPEDFSTDGTKYLTVEITGATAPDVDFSIGLPAHRTKIVLKIADVDCVSDLEGTYNATNCYPDPTVISTWVEDADRNGRYAVDRITGGYFAFAGVPNIQGILLEQCGNIVTQDPIVINYSDGSPAIIVTVTSGNIAADGTITINWTDSGPYQGPYDCTTTFVP